MKPEVGELVVFYYDYREPSVLGLLVGVIEVPFKHNASPDGVIYQVLYGEKIYYENTVWKFYGNSEDSSSEIGKGTNSRLGSYERIWFT